jgi:ATP-dependent Zn protease
VTDEQRRATAYHEAGHAVAAYFLETESVGDVSIVPDPDKRSQGHCVTTLRHDHVPWTDGKETIDEFAWTLNEITVLFAGDAAESLVTGASIWRG